MAAGGDDDTLRLVAVIDHQRHELDRIRAAAAEQSVVAMARGVLMERHGLSSAEAASQLAGLAAATGVSLAEMAAAVLSPEASAARDATGDVHPPRSGAPGQAGQPELGSPWAEAAAELAADGAELASTIAGQLPPGAAAVVLWLLEADGALALLGTAGLSSGETTRWRHIPPQLDCPPQRVARGAADLWWSAGRPVTDRAPVTGTPGGARAVLALRERNGELLGVMEASWPEPVAGLHGRDPPASVLPGRRLCPGHQRAPGARGPGRRAAEVGRLLAAR